MTANWCLHGFHIPEFPRELTALRCPFCYPERPPSAPEEEWGDWVAFGWTNTIRNVVMSRGWVLFRGDADAITGEKAKGTRREQVEDLMSECRAHLLSKRAVLTRVACQGLPSHMIPLGWGSVAMRAYVKELSRNRLIDIQARSSAWVVEYEKQDFGVVVNQETGDEEEMPTAQTSAGFAGSKLQQGAALDAPVLLGSPSLTVPSDILRRIDIERALARIGVRQRDAFLARCRGEKWPEVAARFGANERTARRWVKSAEETMREVLA